MAMMTDKEKQNYKMVGIIAVVIVAVYLIGAYAGWIPAGYNVFQMGKQEVTPPAPVHAAGTGYIGGVPASVNYTDFPTYEINISVACNTSYIGGMKFVAATDSAHSTVWFTADNANWVISDDGMNATYVGDDLTNGVILNSLHLQVDNTALHAASSMTLTASATLGTLNEHSYTIDFVA